ncbi:2-hydroxyacid dehydrogenase [Cohnella herbarum]|uniref:Glyoxylate/hydroxypyruvate reductase B n=1 Tax=Cohnella herbarum TaxID=2728023 RepID=A0A7Z2VPM7_9BACL|nr:D-glycerate dehydrogenase [Cohnella herbarum]QJD86851.1 D-glycerate dehydrogenase [Cohnella herbarum]
MKPKVYVTRQLPEEVLAIIHQSCDARAWEDIDLPVPRDVLEREITDVEGLYCLLTDQVDKALLERAPRLKVISNMAVGYNNIDVEEATRRGIMVTNTPGVLTETTADLTFALLMATARRLPEASEYLRKGSWQTWSPMLLTGQDVYGATLGIIGMGRIGEALVKRAHGFNMNLLYYNRTRKPEVEEAYDIRYTDMDELLSVSDFVCVLIPYSTETRDLIGAKELRQMKPTAVLINTARGGIVNEEALYEALRVGTIWAAGLDVFDREPVAPDHPLLTLPNLVSLPHIGSASVATRMKMSRLAADQLIDAIYGRRPANLVNPSTWGG